MSNDHTRGLNRDNVHVPKPGEPGYVSPGEAAGVQPVDRTARMGDPNAAAEALAFMMDVYGSKLDDHTGIAATVNGRIWSAWSPEQRAAEIDRLNAIVGSTLLEDRTYEQKVAYAQMGAIQSLQ